MPDKNYDKTNKELGIKYTKGNKHDKNKLSPKRQKVHESRKPNKDYGKHGTSTKGYSGMYKRRQQERGVDKTFNTGGKLYTKSEIRKAKGLERSEKQKRNSASPNKVRKILSGLRRENSETLRNITPEENVKIKKSVVSNATNPDKSGGGFMRTKRSKNNN